MKPSKAFIKPSAAPQRCMKIKIEVNFFSSSEIGAGRVKILNKPLICKHTGYGTQTKKLKYWSKYIFTGLSQINIHLCSLKNIIRYSTSINIQDTKTC